MVIKITSIELYLYKNSSMTGKRTSSSIGLQQSRWWNLSIYRDWNNPLQNASIIHNTSALTDAWPLPCASHEMLVTMSTLIIPSTVYRYSKISPHCYTDVRCFCGKRNYTRSTASLWKAPTSCWWNTVVASFHVSNPLITNAFCALLASIFSSLNAFAHIWQTTEQMTQVITCSQVHFANQASWKLYFTTHCLLGKLKATGWYGSLTIGE